MVLSNFLGILNFLHLNYHKLNLNNYYVPSSHFCFLIADFGVPVHHKKNTKAFDKISGKRWIH